MLLNLWFKYLSKFLCTFAFKFNHFHSIFPNAFGTETSRCTSIEFLDTFDLIFVGFLWHQRPINYSPLTSKLCPDARPDLACHVAIVLHTLSPSPVSAEPMSARIFDALRTKHATSCLVGVQAAVSRLFDVPEHHNILPVPNQAVAGLATQVEHSGLFALCTSNSHQMLVVFSCGSQDLPNHNLYCTRLAGEGKLASFICLAILFFEPFGDVARLYTHKGRSPFYNFWVKMPLLWW